MKKSNIVKNNGFQVLCLSFMFFLLVGCGKDESPEDPPLVNELIINSDTYALNSSVGIITDYGPDGTHYNYDFVITDGTVIADGSDWDIEEDSYTLVIYMELYSLGLDEFKEGTFVYSETNENNYFRNIEVEIDTNGDGKLDDDDNNDSTENVTEGSVIVTGSDKDYTLEFNLKYGNDTVTGRFSSSDFLLN